MISLQRCSLELKHCVKNGFKPFHRVTSWLRKMVTLKKNNLVAEEDFNLEKIITSWLRKMATKKK